MNILALLQHAPIALLFTAGALVVLLLAFLWFFVRPAVGIRARLGKVIKELEAEPNADVARLQAIFSRDVSLAHLWTEFRKTLHGQTVYDEGVVSSANLRATAPAEAFFNGPNVVDGRLRTEFFKHLPGIFTGIGIIGTFAGLIVGLQSFKVSEDAGQVRESLELLLGGVFEAFFVSAFAIALAMVVTLVEKLYLASLYRCTDTISHHLDSLYRTGATEEYLDRLARSSEESASQARILKDSLVGDLKAMLQEVTERQISAQAAQTAALGKEITESLATSLHEPLRNIGVLVEKASGDQSATAAELMKDVMASFSQKLSDLFGGQISGIQELTQRSAQAMQDAVASLNTLVGSMQTASQNAGTAMSDKMQSALEQMELRQKAINDQTEKMVSAIRAMVETSQTKTTDTLNQAVSDLGSQVTGMVKALQDQSSQAHGEQQRREEAMSSRAQGMVTDLGASVSSVVEHMAASTSQMQQAVASLERTTSHAMDKLSSGAITLEQGAVNFAKAGDRVTGALDRAAVVADKMTEVSGSLTTSSTALQSVVSDYRANREATASLLSQVKAVVESARHEASLTERALKLIDSASIKLSQAQLDAEQYLDGVSKVLADAQSSFQEGMLRTLDRANSEFHEKLTSAVGMLGSTILELDSTLAGASMARR